MTLDLEAIKARAEAVSHAVIGSEWTAKHHPNGWHVEGAREEHPVIRDLRETVVHTWHGSRGAALAEFIAHARSDVPALVAEVERLRSQEARADKVMQMVANDGHNDGSDGCLSCAAVAEWFATDPLDSPPQDHGSDRHGYVEVQGPMGSDIFPDPPDTLVDSLLCPDCLSNLFLRWDGERWHSKVAHDDGCPRLAAIERGGS